MSIYSREPSSLSTFETSQTYQRSGTSMVWLVLGSELVLVVDGGKSTTNLYTPRASSELWYPTSSAIG